MNIYTLLPSGIIDALGWTLLHSLWQSLVILGLVSILLKIIPLASSGYRYSVALAGLVLTLLAGITTFSILYTAETASSPASPISFIYFSAAHADAAPTDLLSTTITFIQHNLFWLVVAWLIGAILFMTRVIGGGIYVSRLRKDASLIDGYWHNKVQEIAAQLTIERTILLAESVRVQAPIVLGYIKPLIIIPTGMLTGLTTAQLETIFIHELTHIRRHDYLVNLLQLIVEAIFFYNPFVWKLSAIIRDEREHCCDDAVVKTSGNAATYATALVQLEEVRLGQAGIALSLAENKNQLLNRIKRLMEKSVKHYSGRERIIPVVLLVLGLLCASWLTISARTKEHNFSTKAGFFGITQDTTIKTKKKNRHIEAPPAIPVEPVEPVEIEKAVPATEATGPLSSITIDPPMITVDVPIIAIDAPIVIPSVPFDAMAPLAPINVQLDSIPPIPAFHFDYDMNNFAQEFEKTFKQNFSAFYKDHQKDFDKMMMDIKVKIENKDLESLKQMQADAMVQMKIAQENMMIAKQQALIAHQDAVMQQSKQMHEMQDQMLSLQKNMKVMQENMQSFEKALKEELVKDGYLKKDEKINNINWSDNDVEINGFKIKDSDIPKYRMLHDKFFDEKQLSIKKTE
ncbi:MAG TPA: M56 family metallopeptidase [Ohtaekwangia sp.]|uniref:M56 family metallopeptidase n=1 Tax=Ohtaekwangia sp. TaxID=2066019 RepID=UPI002F939386